MFKLLRSFKLQFTLQKDKSSFEKRLKLRILTFSHMFYHIQFFKTFLLAYFNYCLSLIIYFPKQGVQSLNKTFNSSDFPDLKAFKIFISLYKLYTSFLKNLLGNFLRTDVNYTTFCYKKFFWNKKN